jgi:hypothetical protein
MAKPTVICGRLEKGKKNVSINYYASVADEVEGRMIHLDAVADGYNNFKFKIDIPTPISYGLTQNGQWMFADKFIAPGDSVMFDFSDNEQIHVDGPWKEIVNFQFRWEEKFTLGEAAIREMTEANKKPLQPFLEFWKKRYKDQIDYLNTYFHGHVGEPFKSYMENVIKYNYAVALLQYSYKHDKNAGVFRDPQYMGLILGVLSPNESLLNNSAYIRFVKEMPFAMWRCHVDINNKKSPETKYYLHNQYRQRDSLAKRYFKGKSYDVALYHILYDQISNLDHFRNTPEFGTRCQAIDSSLRLTYRNSFVDKAYLYRLGGRLNAVKGILTQNATTPPQKPISQR